MTEIAIKVKNLSKCYQIYDRPQDRLKQMVAPRLQGFIGQPTKSYGREFWALRNVSFEVAKGETVGIIGRNGSGKSTLLQMICSTLNPTDGEIITNGRVAALLELGSGFNPEFTGRENVYLNASILGLTNNEIADRFDEILAFADIGEFINQPVKSYSSGMVVRLAFAVNAHVNAEILVVDEALAVGDVFFQQKCMRHLRSFQSLGGTVVFVSHDIAAVSSLCNKAVLLSAGILVGCGKTDDICQKYLEEIYSERTTPPEIVRVSHINHETKNAQNDVSLHSGYTQQENIINITPFRSSADSFGQLGAEITDAWFENKKKTRLITIIGGDEVDFYIKVRPAKTINWPAFGFMIKDRLGQYVVAEGTDLAFRRHTLILQKDEVILVRFSFVMPILIQGEYTINVAVAEGIGDDHIQHHWINDAMGLQSIKSRLINGMIGLQNLHLEVRTSNNRNLIEN